MLNIMEFGPPPARFMSWRATSYPMPRKTSTGSTKDSRKLASGEAYSMISLVNSAPESYSRWVRSGSSIRPVL